MSSGLLTHVDLQQSLAPPVYLLSFFFVVAVMIRLTPKRLDREEMTRQLVRAFLPLVGVNGLAMVLALDALTPIAWWMFFFVYPLTVAMLVPVTYLFSLLLSSYVGLLQRYERGRLRLTKR